MANVAYSADIQDLRGKVGTNVFSKARSGSTVRIRTSGKNPRRQEMQGVGYRVSGVGKAQAFSLSASFDAE